MSDTPLDLAHYQRLLIHRREELSEAHRSGEDAAQTVELDQSRVGRVSRMDALQSQAMAKDSQQRRTIELQRIDAALQRLEKGEYGMCLRCGECIAPKRLAFDPTAPLCIQCANNRET